MSDSDTPGTGTELVVTEQPKPIDIEDQVREILRELRVRRDRYPGWVQAGKLQQAVADYRIKALEAVLRTLKATRQPELL
jgi:hypothetical protein